MFASRLPLVCALIALSAARGPGLDTAVPGQAAAPAIQVRQDDAADGEHARPLPFFYDLYTFRGRADSTAVVTAYAVEAGRLETRSVASGVLYRFSVTLVLADTARRTVWGTHDTVYVDVPRQLPGEHLLYTHVEALAAPSTTTQQRVIMIDATTPGIGQLYTEVFPIPDYSGTQLMLSDIALGLPDAMHGWKRGGNTLALLPTSQLPTSAFDVYYEIYNLPAGHRYTTEIVIARADESGAAASASQPIRLRFDGESVAGPDGLIPELRRVESSLSRGSYHLGITVTEVATGRTASKSRPFTVRGGDRGVTMVAALPNRGGSRSRRRR